MTIVYYSDTDSAHRPRTFFIRGVPSENREIPERSVHLLNALKEARQEIRGAQDFGLEPIARVHTARYLTFLAGAYDAWRELDAAAAEIIPNAFPLGNNATYPDSIVGKAGFHMADMACPINAGTWVAAYGSAQSALSAANGLLNGEAFHIYGLCRPPGHHAFAERASGYCFINNAAVAAQFLRDRGLKRVSILDIDVHHGNGTQEIFYNRGDVQTVSVHCDPANYYPFFWGYEAQTGAGDGMNANSNFSLPFKTGDKAYLHTLGEALQVIDTFAPEAIVVSLGLDTFRGDPYAAMDLTSGCFREIGAAIARMKLPTLILQEGGYICPELGGNLVSFLSGFEEAGRV